MSSLKFGTSGLRGLVVDLDGPPASAYSRAFVDVLAADGDLTSDRADVYIGRDLRASSPSIAARAAAAVAAAGFVPVDCGAVPTPALALAAMRAHAPAIMVTGSHIPDDRNGLKFYRAAGEITKADETAIVAAHQALGSAAGTPPTAENVRTRQVLADFEARYRSFFPAGGLTGLKIGVYQHSSVARDVIVHLLEERGAVTVPLGRSNAFIPVDTEAVRDEDRELALQWASEHGLDAIVSTDGDADRPLIADNNGIFLRGDLVGALTARHLGIDTIVTPVTSNGRIEMTGAFASVLRTRVGSPFVIAAMDEALATGAKVLGFEANGGCLLGSDVESEGRTLAALPTRDSILPILSVLSEIKRVGRPLSEIVAAMGFNAAASTRIENCSAEQSGPFLTALANDVVVAATFFAQQGGTALIDQTDGVRVTTGTSDVVHFRASGNAPELRIYTEGRTEARANELLEWARNGAETAMA